MSDIKLDENESALWYEVGSRGDLFRAAMRDRAHEQTRLSGRMTEICDPVGRMLDAVQPADPVAVKVYDDESERAVANLPDLHRGESPVPTAAPWPVDSGKEIAGELHRNDSMPKIETLPHDNKGWMGAAPADQAHRKI